MSKCKRLDKYHIRYTNEEILDKIKLYIKENNKLPRQNDFLVDNGLVSIGLINERFGSYENAMNLLGYNKEDLLFYKQVYTDNELIKMLQDYNRNIGFPTQRKFKASNGLPCYNVYYERFGSFKNAILISRIEIPNNRKRYFDRESLTDDEMLKQLEYFTKEHLKYNLYLPTLENINECRYLQSSATYLSRFKSVENMFKLIGYDLKDFNKKALEKDMIDKYLELCELLGHTANSREIEKASLENEGYFYGCTTYLNHFKTINNLQEMLGLRLSGNKLGKTKETLLEELKRLSEELGRPPLQKDVNECEYTSSTSKYNKEFGGFLTALELIGYTNIRKERKSYITENGTNCLSFYEYVFCSMLEKNNIKYKKEEFYSKYIEGFKKKYRFDFTVEYNNDKYFIEIFGMTGIKEYDLKAKEKIDICKENNLNIIPLYPEDFNMSNMNYTYSTLKDKIINYSKENTYGQKNI